MPDTCPTDISLSLDDESSVKETVSSLVEIVEQQSKRINELEDQVDENFAYHSKERADIHKRLSEVEETVSQDETPTPETEETTIQQAETPLEDIIQLPEEVVEDNLTANQERARFVAKDILDYSRSVPAGYALKSSQLRRVLTAKEDSSAHTETVSRVIERLDDLGKDGVQVRETRSGERTVVFTEEIVKRIVAYRNQNHSVVSGTEVSG
ncbi:hypothetical protein PNP59_11670 [Halobacterium salinarum]|uniref:hypothetical protein n=1 Tax=Halobacterium salinarum TaxID=2242 RepID=UPI0025556F3E|nr:hypothetical protein [Halobacterium salinarum]MDL0130917.1 hypothetical protein [Halobacterium salinarum]MDL0131583.1 hypothetical protein [Halobacterium salinarum]